jgi:predicted peptidase
VITALIISACEQPEEILPAQPVPDSTAAVIKAEASKATEVIQPVDSLSVDSLSVDSAKYRYGKFRDMPYRILYPKNYDATKNYPLLLFLHGIGERGSDNEQQLTWGASLFQVDSIRDKYESFIVFPQCLSSNYWFDAWGIGTLKDLTDALISEHKIDQEKIYIGGLSMGAYGTYSMVAAYPQLFAAAIAISGDGDEHKAPQMSKTKWRIFAGRKDNVVSSDKSQKMARALANSGASVSFTLYPQADHVGSWVNAFKEPDFCSWLFAVSQRKDKH